MQHTLCVFRVCFRELHFFNDDAGFGFTHEGAQAITAKSTLIVLRAACNARKISSVGNKNELLTRLKEAAASGNDGHASSEDSDSKDDSLHELFERVQEAGDGQDTSAELAQSEFKGLEQADSDDEEEAPEHTHNEDEDASAALAHSELNGEDEANIQVQEGAEEDVVNVSGVNVSDDDVCIIENVGHQPEEYNAPPMCDHHPSTKPDDAELSFLCNFPRCGARFDVPARVRKAVSKEPVVMPEMPRQFDNPHVLDWSYSRTSAWEEADIKYWMKAHPDSKYTHLMRQYLIHMRELHGVDVATQV